MCTKKLTLLHSNDLHGDFLAEDANEKLVGGVSMLSGYINQVREEEDNVLYCIAGDMFRGSVIDSEFQGLSTIEIMNMLAPDVVTIGNHETDYGVAHLLFIEKCSKFPIVNANMKIKFNDSRLFKPHVILEVDGMKILFIGILTQDTLSQTKNDGLIGTFVDISEAAEEVGKICNSYNAVDIDFTVLLTHIGFEEDKKLAALLDPSWGVDVIVGGHSHTFIDEPAVVNGIPIVQAGTGTDLIGRMDLVIDTDRNCIQSYTWKTVPIDSQHCPNDENIERLITNFKNKTDAKYGKVVTRFNYELFHPERTRETEIGDVYTTALKESLGVDIMLLGSGSIRTEKIGPIVTLQDLMENFPYKGAVYMVTMNGEMFKRGITHMLRDEVWTGVHCEFYQLSDGLNITYNRATHTFERFDFKGEPLQEDQLITVGLQKYHYVNMEETLHISPEECDVYGKARVVCTSDFDVLQEYLSEHQHLGGDVEDRLVII